jgi:Fe-S-cluster containining protein
VSSEVERVLGLMNELLSDRAYATGDRPFPTRVSPADATLIGRKLQEAVEEGTEVRSRKAMEEGLSIACSMGCNACCQQPILVWLPEAMVVAEHLRQPENAAVRDAFLAAYPAWRAAVGDSLERAADEGATRDLTRFRRAHQIAWSKRTLCAFNMGGLCSIYPARPVQCRHYHALDTAEHCGYESNVQPAHLDFKPLDEFVSRAKLVASAMHHALGAPHMRMVVLCTAVYDMLMG